MHKRSRYLGLFIVLNLAILLIVWHARQKGDLRGPMRPPTDLQETEYNDALKVLVDERHMWWNLQSLSGHMKATVSVNNQEAQTLECDITIKDRAGTKDTPTKLNFELKMRNEDEHWDVTTDTRAVNETINCQAPQTATVIRTFNPATLAAVLAVPRAILLSLYKDELFPQGKVNFQDLPYALTPSSNTNASGIPHSYTFKAHDPNGNELSFINGHLATWHRMRSSSVSEGDILLSDPVDSNGFFYPSRIEYYGSGKAYTISLSRIAVQTKERALK